MEILLQIFLISKNTIKNTRANITYLINVLYIPSNNIFATSFATSTAVINLITPIL